MTEGIIIGLIAGGLIVGGVLTVFFIRTFRGIGP